MLDGSENASEQETGKMTAPTCTSMKKSLVLVVIFLTTALCSAGTLRDGRAWPYLEFLRTLLCRPVEKRQLAAEEARKYATALDMATSEDVAVCAALILAWADDESSLRSLAKFNTREGWRLADGAVTWSLSMRELRKAKKDYYENLCEAVRTADTPLKLLFYANRLWGDFGEQGLDVIYQAGLSCNDDSVKEELFIYIGETNSPILAEKALKHPWIANNGESGSLQLILDMMGRHHAPRKSFAGEAYKSLKQLQNTLQKAREKAASAP